MKETKRFLRAEIWTLSGVRGKACNTRRRNARSDSARDAQRDHRARAENAVVREVHEISLDDDVLWECSSDDDENKSTSEN